MCSGRVPALIKHQLRFQVLDCSKRVAKPVVYRNPLWQGCGQHTKVELARASTGWKVSTGPAGAQREAPSMI